MENEQGTPGENPAARGAGAGRRFIAVGAALAALVLAALGLTAAVYLPPVTAAGVRKITAVMPYPAAVVGWDAITIRDFLFNYDALMMANAGALEGANPEYVELLIMDMLVQKQVVRQLARRYGITLDEAQVGRLYEDLVSQQADAAALAQNLETALGWSVDDYMDRVIRPFALAEQVSGHILQDADIQAGSRTAIEAALARLNAGEEFAQVAADVNGPGSADEMDGNVGYFKLSDIPEAWRDMVEGLAAGSHSAVIEEPLDYLILNVNDRIQAGDDTQVDLSVIIVRKRTLEDIADEYLGQTRVVRFLGKG